MNEHEQRKRLLSTSSPEGLHIAAEITSTRIAEFLIREGPQPMRRINSQLAIEVQGFDQLSLSKQRRLIMSAMEQVDPKNNCVFEKIGWGQWAVRKVDSDYIESKDTTTERRVSVQDLRSQGVKLGWSKKSKKPAVVKLALANGPLTRGPDRRESISNNRVDLHDIRPPSGSAVSDSEDDFALSDDDDVEQGIESDSESDLELDEGVFQIDDAVKTQTFKPLSMRLPPPIKFAQRVPLKVSPPPGIQGQRRRSLNSSLVSKPRHSQYFSRSRLNSYDALDNYIGLSQKGSGTSLSPGPGVATPALLTLPWNRGNYIHQPGPVEGFPGGRRKSLFNELHIRLTLLQLLPKLNQRPQDSQYRTGVVFLLPEMQEGNDISNAVGEDTDEEDWATIGAELLRSKDKDRLKQESEEAQAAQALVNLMSV